MTVDSVPQFRYDININININQYQAQHNGKAHTSMGEALTLPQYPSQPPTNGRKDPEDGPSSFQASIPAQLQAAEQYAVLTGQGSPLSAIGLSVC
jgi:hypothetical protein